MSRNAHPLVRLSIATLLGLGMAVVSVDRAAACRCGPPLNDAEAMAAADVSFVGTVTDELVFPLVHDFEIPQITYEFVVDRWIKGPVDPHRANVLAQISPRGCGIDIAKGQHWLILATISDGTMQTNACSGSRPVDERQLTVNESPSAEVGLGQQLLIAGAILASVAAISVFAFRPRGRRSR